MSRAARSWAIVLAVAALTTAGAAGSPYALRRVDAFRVQRVELAGARFMTPEHAVAASGISARSTLFDDFELWRRALESDPLVLRASVSRRLPGTLLLDVVEAEPIALVGTPELQPVDARGQVLPIDPAAFALDLPIMAGDPHVDSAGRVHDAALLGVIDALQRVREAQPWLASWTSELEPVAGGVRLRLRWPASAEVLLPPAPETGRLHEVRLAVADLIARTGDGSARPAGAAPDVAFGDTELARLVRLDARYRDQVVVRLAAAGVRARGAT